MGGAAVKWRLTLTEPEIGQEEIEAVTRVLQSKWLTMGAVVADFEQAFARKMQVRHAIAVNNCTAALHLAYVAAGVGPGDEVIVPDLTFVATASAARHTGAEVLLADVVSEHDLTVDPRSVESLITARTKAICVVHYAGFLCDMESILKLASHRGIMVIEDAAHAPFASKSLGGETKFAGAIGDIGCFSFFGNKNMTTGEGGMLTTNSDELAARMRLLRSHGMTTLTYERHKGHASGYDVLEPGFNYRMDEMHAAFGLAQLAKVDRMNERRREVTAWYREALVDNPRVVVPFLDRPLSESTCHIMPVLVDSPQEVRDRLKEAGVQTSKHYEPISWFTAYQGAASRTKEIADRLVTLPLGPSMTEEDVQLVAGLL
jgi:dTDP-4-amino-4,6-dideoxygalactose transaminase